MGAPRERRRRRSTRDTARAAPTTRRPLNPSARVAEACRTLLLLTDPRLECRSSSIESYVVSPRRRGGDCSSAEDILPGGTLWYHWARSWWLLGVWCLASPRLVCSYGSLTVEPSWLRSVGSPVLEGTTMFSSTTARTASPSALSGADPRRDFATAEREPLVQVHLRLSVADRNVLLGLAKEREQTLSGAVRYLLKAHVRTTSR